MALDQHPGPSVLDGAGEAADFRGEDRRSAGLRLQRHQAEGLAVGGHHHDVGGPVPAGQLRGVHRRVVGGDVVHSGGADQRLEVEVLGAADGPQDGQLQVDVRAPGAQERRRLDQDLRALEPLDTACEQQMELARGDAVLGPGPVPEGRREDGQVHAGRRDVDVVDVGVVVRDQLGRFGAGIGDQPGRAVDNPVLAVLTPPRLGLFAGLEELVLDLRHRVHGVDEGQPPQLRELQPGHPGDPVMGMDDVIPAVRLEQPDPVDLGHHAVQEPRELLLGQLTGRAGEDVVHAHARGRVFDGGLRGRGGPGEDLHFHAGLGEGRGQRPDVHVHAAGVTGAGLFHGRGVQGKESDAADQRHGSPFLCPFLSAQCMSIKHYS
ncbi:hypothetical protein SRABI128_06223 [Microbacterium sp. Bi128]|nr:hypothetical protein SRABI128_06223 [Microbacterium sp. Bi128]